MYMIILTHLFGTSMKNGQLNSLTESFNWTQTVSVVGHVIDNVANEGCDEGKQRVLL